MRLVASSGICGDGFSIWDRVKLSVVSGSSAGSLQLNLLWLCLWLFQGMRNCTCLSHGALQHCWALQCGIQQTGQAMLRAGL